MTMNLKLTDYAGRNYVAITNQGDDQPLQIDVHGVIGASFWEDSISSKDIVDQIKDYNGSEIELSISSPGGDAGDGIAIFNVLRRHDATVNVFIDGMALSAGSVIAMAGDSVEMAANGMFMIHDPMTIEIGNAADMRKTAGILDQWAQALAQSYRRSNFSIKELRNLMSEETWYTADEALEAGFVDSVSEASSAIEASAFLKNFQNVPKDWAKHFKSKGKPMPKAKEPDKKPVEDPKPTEPVAVQPEPVKAEQVDPREEMRKYIDAFGAENGAQWYVDNVQWDECRKQQVQNLQELVNERDTEIKDLKERLVAAIAASGEKEPVSADNSGDPTPKKNQGLAGRIKLNKSS